jgi:hypothetical protein
MKRPVQRTFDPVLAQTGAPDAAVVNGPCRCHGDVLVQYCEVFTQDLQPGVVGIARLPVCLN